MTKVARFSDAGNWYGGVVYMLGCAGNCLY